MAASRTNDLLGQTFNFLTAIKDLGKRHNADGHSMGTVWLCECICGNTREVLNKHLKNGSTSSCGCKRVANARIGSAAAAKKKTNKTNWVDSVVRIKKSLYIKRARRDNKIFDLTLDQFQTLVTGTCIYCGVKPRLDPKDRNMSHKDLLGIDRVDSAQGYVVDNCVSCCKTCNYAKAEQTVQEFKDWVKRVNNHLNP